MNVVNKNIVIVGDSIVDEFVHLTKMGDSAEAVPTYREVSRQTYSGGAANVAKHCLQLGANVFLVDNDPTWHGFTKDDGLSDEAKFMWGDREKRSWKFSHEYLCSAPVKKQRFLVDDIKTFKVNAFDDRSIAYSFEKAHDFKGVFTAFLEEHSEYGVLIPDLVVAADNRHGMFSAASARSLVKTCQERSLRLLVDSQMSQSEPDWSVWDGCHSLFLNDNELVAWERGIGKRPAMLHHKMGVNGSDVFSERRDYCPGFHVNVVDTLGAGDAYLAAWAVTEDIRTANAWAALSCTKPGTALPTLEELEKLLATFA